MNRFVWVLAAVALAGCNFKFDRALDPGEIRGHLLILGSDGKKLPAANAIIRVENSSVAVRAGADGRFTIRQLQAGAYTLNISAQLSDSTERRGLRLRNLVLDQGINGLGLSRDLGDIELGAYGSLTGTVVGTIRSGTLVALPGVAKIDVGTDGSYTSGNLIPGDYDVMLYAPTDTSAKVAGPITVTVKAGAPTAVDPFTLDQIEEAALASGSLSGTAILVGAGSNNTISVTVRPTPASLEAAQTSEAGLYTITQLEPGVYDVVAGINDVEAVVPFVVVGSGTTPVPTIALQLDTTQTIPEEGVCTSGKTSCDGTCVDLLTDSNNCGLCGNVCPTVPQGLTGACTYAACLVTLAPDAFGSAGPIVDATNIYWHDFSNQILSLPLVGGTPTTLGSGTFVTGLTQDATNLYWAATNGIFSLPKAGGTKSTLFFGADTRARMAIDANNLYWAAQTGVYSIPIAGGMPTTLVTGHNAYGIDVDANNVYWTEQSAGLVGSVSKQGGTPATLASGQRNPSALVVQGSFVYWVNDADDTNGGGSVMRVASAGGTPSTMSVNAEANRPQGLVADANFVYWSNYGTGTIYAAPLNGQPAFRVTAEQANPWYMAIDAGHIYWSTSDKLVYAPKPPAP